MDRFQRRIRITARTGPVEQSGGIRRRALETRDYEVTMTVDVVEILERLAKKAALSKGKKAKALHGSITVAVKAS